MSPSGSKITWADQSHHQTQPTPPVPQSLPLASVPIAPTPRHAGPSAEKNWITCSDSEGWIGYGHKGSGSMARGSSPAHERSGSNTSTAGSASASASASALVSAPVLPPRPTVTTHTSERSASSTKPSFLLEYGLEEEGEEDSDHDQGHDKEQVRKPPAVIMNRLRSRSRSRSGSGASSAKGSTGSGGNRIVVVVSNQSTTSETAQPAVPAVSVVTDQDANGQEIEDETQYSYTGRRAPRPRQLHEIAQAQAQAARLTPPALPARPRSAPSVTQEVIASSVPASTAATGTASAATAQSATSQGADEHGQLTADPFEMDGNADTAGAGDAFAIATEQTATGIPQTRTSRALGEIGLAVATHAVPGLWGARPSSESNAPASSSLAIAIANGSNVCAREAPTQDGNSVPEDALMDAGTAPAPVPPALPPRRPNGVSLTDGISQVDGVPQPDGDVPQPAPAPASTKTLAKEEKAREKARKKEEELRRKEEDARLKRQKKLETQKQQQEEMERKVLMASWEELEVARYLSDFGKVRFGALDVSSPVTVIVKRRTDLGACLFIEGGMDKKNRTD